MINTVIGAISAALFGEFNCEIHMEEVKQGLEVPCFFITALNPTIQKYPGGRYKRENQFVIQYLPESEEEAGAECYSTAERMNWCLEEIEAFGKKLLAHNRNYEIVDGVLNYYVNYNFFIYKTRENSGMETMELDNQAKG